MSYSVDPTVAEDLEHFKNLKTSHLSNVSNTITSTEWNDDLFNQNYGIPARGYLHSKGDSERVCALSLVCLANYLGIKENTPSEIIELYKSFLPSMVINGKHVFHPTGNGIVAAITMGEVDISNYKFPGAASTIQLNHCSTTKNHVKAFWNEMVKMSNSNSVTRGNMISLVCFIMLIMPATC